MNKFSIDTSAWIEYFSDPTEELTNMIEKGNIITSIIAIAELADKFIRNDKNISKALDFIQQKAKIINLNIPIAVEAAKVKKGVRKKNEKFGLADGIHYATAKKENAILLTKDNDFQGLVDVRFI